MAASKSRSRRGTDRPRICPPSRRRCSSSSLELGGHTSDRQAGRAQAGSPTHGTGGKFGILHGVRPWTPQRQRLSKPARQLRAGGAPGQLVRLPAGTENRRRNPPADARGPARLPDPLPGSAIDAGLRRSGADRGPAADVDHLLSLRRPATWRTPVRGDLRGRCVLHCAVNAPGGPAPAGLHGTDRGERP